MASNEFHPWRQGPRLRAVVGHYGSGKTEFALNLALRAKEDGHESLIADMDIVNPFFRSAEQKAMLESRGVELIYPPYALSGVDLPVLPADLLSVFARPALRATLDIGGEDAGAAALGRFKPYFDQEDCAVYYVVNPFRPFSENADQVVAMLGRIEARSRLKVTGLVNNANMGFDTRPEDLLAGEALLNEVAARTGVPVVCACLDADAAFDCPALSAPIFALKRYLVPEWGGR